MTHANPTPKVKTALYQNYVQFGDKRIPFKMVLSSVLSGSKLLRSIQTEQHLF